MKKAQIFKISALVLLLCWCVVIFLFSAQNAEKSSDTSSGIVIKIVKTLYPEFENFSTEKQESITNTLTFAVRKTAHFSEYFVLGALTFVAAVTFYKYKFLIRSLVAFVFCILYSISDEVHQYFVPGRACRMFDIFVDSCGSLTAIILLSVIVLKSKKIRSKLGDIDA